jgi:HAD superfamily hydrolase (TIGR01509 family)
MTIRAVLFDCDGVIVDSERPMMELLHEDMNGFGLDVDFESVVTMNLGGAVPQFLPKLRAMGADVPDGWVDDFYERLYTTLAHGTPLIDGAETAVIAVQQAGLSMAIGSNGRHEKMDITLGQHPALKSRFGDHIYSGQELSMMKPAPDLYLHIADQLNIAPHHCAVIEDSATGARAAREAGMSCYGYAAPGSAATQLRSEGAQVFSDMRALPDLLGLSL